MQATAAQRSNSAQSAQDAQPQQAAARTPAAPPLPKRVRQVPAHLCEFVVESTVGQEQQDRGSETECKRLFFSTIDNVTGEIYNL